MGENSATISQSSHSSPIINILMNVIKPEKECASSSNHFFHIFSWVNCFFPKLHHCKTFIKSFLYALSITRFLVPSLFSPCFQSFFGKEMRKPSNKGATPSKLRNVANTQFPKFWRPCETSGMKAQQKLLNGREFSHN